jgi:hypothetical protein
MTATVGLCSRLLWRSTVLPRYHFHLYNDVETRDQEGRVFEDLAAAHADAVHNARSIMASELTSRGEITLSHWIELETEEGDLHVVTFGDAVTINP